MRGKQSLNNLKRLLKKYKLVVDEWTLPFSFSESLKLMHLVCSQRQSYLLQFSFASFHWYVRNKYVTNTSQKMKFPIKDFFSKCDQIRKKLRIWSHLLKKSLMENFIFCAVKIFRWRILVNKSRIAFKTVHLHVYKQNLLRILVSNYV